MWPAQTATEKKKKKKKNLFYLYGYLGFLHRSPEANFQIHIRRSICENKIKQT